MLRAMRAEGLDLDACIRILEARQQKVKAAPDRDYPVGPKERWGYDGPITPRLSDADWWPLRNSILERDGGICSYCGSDGPKMCADHVVPLSRGGSNDPENLVACCGPCNVSKSDRLLSEWSGRA